MVFGRGKPKPQENPMGMQAKPGLVGKTVDFSLLKDFINYGMSRTLTNILIRRHTDIKAREELNKMKPQTDWQKMGIMFVFLMIGVMVALLITSQYLNVSDCNTKQVECEKRDAICQAQLSVKGSSGIVTPSQPSTGDNLQG